MINKRPEDRKTFVPKENIAFWYPVSHSLKVIVNNIITFEREKNGEFIPPYQMIEKCIRDYAEMNGVSGNIVSRNKEHE